MSDIRGMEYRLKSRVHQDRERWGTWAEPLPKPLFSAKRGALTFGLRPLETSQKTDFGRERKRMESTTKNRKTREQVARMVERAFGETTLAAGDDAVTELKEG